MGLWLQVFALFLLRAHRKDKHLLIARLGFGSARKWGPSRAPDSAARPSAEHFLNSSRRRTEVSSSTQSALVVFRGGSMCSPLVTSPTTVENNPQLKMVLWLQVSSIICFAITVTFPIFRSREWILDQRATRTPAAHPTLRLDPRQALHGILVHPFRKVPRGSPRAPGSANDAAWA